MGLELIMLVVVLVFIIAIVVGYFVWKKRKEKGLLNKNKGTTEKIYDKKDN